ncbi:MAG: DNA-binding protein [Flavobacteriaceae bacterium]|nr:MAG: DNA-binding protein [Flavobacteriaceae bacterium]
MEENSEFQKGQEVTLYIDRKTPLGFTVLIEGKEDGLLYHSEIFEPIEEGDKVKGFIKAIREDGKIDLTLRPQGFRNAIDGDAQKVLDYLKSNGGKSNYHDKSDPKEIYQTFLMSKKAFKKAIGVLYKRKMIEISSDGFFLK